MNRDKTSSSSSSSSSSISPPIISSSSSSSSSSIITSFDQYLEGNLIKVKTGFYDGKLGYITGYGDDNKIKVQLFSDEASIYEKRIIYMERKNLELLFNGIKYIDWINSNSYNDNNLLNVYEKTDSWIKVGILVYIHKGINTGCIGLVKGSLSNGKWLVHLISMRNTYEGKIIATKCYGHELSLVSNTVDTTSLEAYFSVNEEDIINADNIINDEKFGKKKEKSTTNDSTCYNNGYKALSPHSKSKKKKLSSLVAQDNSSQHTDHSDDVDPDDENNEARNNLYWIKDRSFPCLWYGNSTTNPEDSVDVLPIKIHEQNDSIKLPKSTSMIKVKRKNLIPLEAEILRTQCDNEDTKQFALALLDFAEYDDYSRDSYVWPNFIIKLFESPRLCNTWLASARSLKVASKFLEENKLFLFYFCATLMGENVKESQDDERNENLNYLFNIINSPIDLAKEFKRSSSRFGIEYEAILPSLLNEPPVVDDDSNLAFIADQVSDEVLEDYLRIVHALRMRHVSCNHIIEAPPSMFGDPTQESSSQYLSYISTEKNVDIRKTQRKRKGTRFVVCTVVAKKPSKSNEASDLLASCTNDPAVLYELGSLIDDQKHYDVEVFDGASTWTVPLSSCHLLSMPDDKAYEHLHLADYDVKRALQMIEAELVIDRVFEKNFWPSKSLENFVKLAIPYGFPSRDQVDVRELMESYNEIVDNKIKDNTNSLSDSSMEVITKNYISKSFLELTDLLHRFFQGHRAESVAHILDQQALKRRPPLSLQPIPKRPPVVEKPPTTTNDNDTSNDNKMKNYGSNSNRKKKRTKIGPNRWPRHMPLMLHNIYWLKSNNQPCLCLGVDTQKRWQEGVYFRVIAICSSTAHHEISVTISSLEPLTELNLKQCQDEKTVAFTLAMIDFSEWEYDKIKLENPNCDIKWYEYPHFVRNFLLHSPSWKAWRAQVERNARGKREDKRTIYFDALKEDLIALDEVDYRKMDEYPWDDTPLSDDSDNETSDDNEKEKKKKKENPVDDKEKKRKVEKEEKIPTTIHIQEVTKKPQFSPFNLYWIQRSELPCIYLDIPENRDAEKFRVLPLCCSTYHYPVRVNFGEVEPLTITCLKRCREERTHDFALALMGFAAWDLSQRNYADDGGDDIDNHDGFMKAEQRAIHIMHEEFSSLQSSEIKFYEWPEFIPNMINNPRQWQSWRKRVERGAQSKQGGSHMIPKKQLYFAALVEDFKNGLLL